MSEKPSYEELEKRVRELELAELGRQKAEKTARERERSERIYRTIGETIPYGVWVTDAAGYCTYASRSFLDMVGMTMDQVQRFGWLHLLPPEDVEATKNHWMECVRSGAEFEREHRFKSRDGSFRNVLAIGRPVMGENGDITNWAGLNLDITERKKTENELRESERRQFRQRRFLEMLLNQAQACIAVMEGRDFRYTLVNRAYQALRPTMPMIGRTYREVFPEAAAAGSEALLRTVLETGVSMEGRGYHALIPGKPDIAWDHQIDRLPGGDGEESSVLVVTWDVTDHNRLLKELEQSRKDFARAQEVGEIGSWRLDVLNNVLTWSEENHRIFDLPKEQRLTYESFLERVHPDDREYVDTRWKAGLRGDPYDIEHRILRDGDVRWVREKAYLEFDGKGELLGGFGITQDITDRKRAAEALQESEKLYRVLFENMLDGFAYCRMVYADDKPHDFIFLSVNEAFGTLTGLTGVVGKKVTEVIPGIRETDPRLFEIYGRVVRTGHPERFEMFVESLKNWFSVSVYSPVHDHFVIVFDLITELKEMEEKRKKAHDELENRVRERTRELTLSNQQLLREIEERQEAEARLLESKDMLQKVFDGISDPLVLLDREMRVKLLNKSAVDYFGMTGTRVGVGEFCHQAFKSSPNLCRGCRISSAFSNTEDIQFERKGFRDPRREEKVFLYPLRNAKGEPAEIIYRITDVTEKKMFEKRLIQNEKMASLGVLVSSVAHEINNPNAFIAFNIPILKEYAEQLIGLIERQGGIQPGLEICNMPYAEFRNDLSMLIDNIQHGSERIHAFVSNLKDFSRTKFNTNQNWIDLPAVAEKAVSICRAKVKKTVKSFSVEIPDNFPRIHTDPIALEQILINLLINATQAMDKEDSWIRLSASIGGTWLDHAIIEVRDNGCGISENNLSKIFDPFYSTKPMTEGTGLGLYVCHNLVAGLGGRIEVEAKPGEFSAFRVIIPDMERRKKKRG
ncbi:MAG: PAS domain S-box protein [Thermodesulfobacteriota bacterium]